MEWEASAEHELRIQNLQQIKRTPERRLTYSIDFPQELSQKVRASVQIHELLPNVLVHRINIAGVGAE